MIFLLLLIPFGIAIFAAWLEKRERKIICDSIRQRGPIRVTGTAYLSGPVNDKGICLGGHEYTPDSKPIPMSGQP